jgi:cytoskeletal protein CcmA (bactofilin family)
MNAYFALAVTILLAVLLLTLPLAPAVAELQRKSDAGPLSVVHEHAGEIRYFADGFRQYIEVLAPILARCTAEGSASPGAMRDGTRYLVLGSSDDALLLPLRKRGKCDVLIVAAGDLCLPAGISFARDIFAAGSVAGEASNQYRAIFAEGDVHLSTSSVVLRWTHANGAFNADKNCRLYGRISSNRRIQLAADCAFSRLNAPRIDLGSCAASRPNTFPQIVPKEEKHPTPERQLHDGDLELHEGRVFHGNLVVRGSLRIGRGARIYGSIKSEKDLQVEDGVAVFGSLISGRCLTIGRNCSIHGPVIAERKMLIRCGTWCGTPEKQTTVGAPRIVAEEGSVVFGTLWAREAGYVVAK